MDDLTKDLLNDILIYNHETGDFFWKENRSRAIKAGDKAGTTTVDGYRAIKFNKTQYRSHRLAWIMFYGYMPINIDHINHNKSDNRIVNLREADNTENQRNCNIRCINTSGFNGVSYLPKKGGDKKWRASIKVSGKAIYLGYFLTKEEAVEARKSANIKYNFHENHGMYA